MAKSVLVAASFSGDSRQMLMAGRADGLHGALIAADFAHPDELCFIGRIHRGLLFQSGRRNAGVPALLRA